MRLIQLCLSASLLSCAGTQVSEVRSTIEHQISVIGTAPVGGEIADSIASAFADSDATSVQVLNTTETAALLKELNLSSSKALLEENLRLLRQRGLDAWLVLESQAHMVSSDPGSIRLRLASTHAIDQEISFRWKNAWGGMPGSLADATMRRTRAQAAKELADELMILVEELPRE